jgi:hypothetical protein
MNSMAHVYDAQSMVDLPRVKASTAATLGTTLLAAADGEKKLAVNVAAARDGLATANAALRGALQGALDPAVEAPFVPESRAEAVAWSGVASWLDGLARLPLKKKAAAAGALHAALFPNGLSFLRKPTRERWSETERRLEHVKERKLEADFAALGGADVLRALVETHAALGEAAGITTAPAAPTASAKVGESLDGWKAAVRCYVLQVTANAALDKSPEAGVLAARLLEPLASEDSATGPRAPKVPPPPAGSSSVAGA